MDIQAKPLDGAQESISAKKNQVVRVRRLSLKEKILLQRNEKMKNEPSGEPTGHSDQNTCTQGNSKFALDIRDRIRINKEQLDALLIKNPLEKDAEIELNNKRTEKEEEPENSESPPSPSKTYGVSQKYDAVFQSFVKRRPLSEGFAITSYDLSNSSSDEEVSDPVPESPLNLSDTEIMASGFNSPSLFGRRRRRVIASTQSEDKRPQSLYDTAKPHPPSKEKNDKGNSVSEKLSRLIHRRPRKASINMKPEENSYEKSFEPVPPNSWSNIAGYSQGSRLEPHPPTTTPTNAVPNPKKKRHAPKPPTNVAPYDTNDHALNSNPEESKKDCEPRSESSNDPLAPSMSTSVDQSVEPPPEHALETPSSSPPPIPPQRHPKKFKSTPLEEKRQPQNRTGTPPLDTPHYPTHYPTSGPVMEPSISRTVVYATEQAPLSDSDHFPEIQPQKTESPVLKAKLCHQTVLTSTSPTSETNGTPSYNTEIEQAPSRVGSKSSPENDPTASESSWTTNDPKVASPTLDQNSTTLTTEPVRGQSYVPNTPNATNNNQTAGYGDVRADSSAPCSSCTSDQNNKGHVTESARENYVTLTCAVNSLDHAAVTESHLTQSECFQRDIKMVLNDLLKAVEAVASDASKSKVKKLNSRTEDIAFNREKVAPHRKGAKTGKHFVVEARTSHGLVPHAHDVTTDVTMVKDDSMPGKQRSKNSRHRQSTDNASSGYSSPGSGDERPISPETPLSPIAMPSPTSSYYSTSLSASSSRVSNLSRELTLAKQPCVNEDVPVKTTRAEPKHDCPLVEEMIPNDIVPKQEVPGNEKTVKNSENLEKVTNNATEMVNKSQTPFEERSVDKDTDSSPPVFEALPNMPIKLRGKPSVPRIRAKSEYIPYTSESEEWKEHLSRVTISMIEKPGETASLSRAQASLFKPALHKGQKKKALAAQKSRGFAMRAKPHWSQRHSYAEPSSGYILNEPEIDPEVPSSNLVSHFVSTQNISTYYDGKEQKTITPHEILTSKREEFFNAFKNTTLGRNIDQFGGSVRQLPVSAQEFGYINSIEEVTEVDSAAKPIASKSAEAQENEPTNIEESGKKEVIERHLSETGSTDSSAPNSSVFTGSTWSLSTDMTSQTRQRKPSLRKRLQGAFSFQNIRKAISTEKLNDEEKRRSMSHHYLDETGAQCNGGRQRSATLQENSTSNNDPGQPSNLRKATSISSIISSVRMRKRRSRSKADPQKRYTIADPESFAKSAENVPETKRSTRRPMSMVLSNANRIKLEDVGNPNFFRTIGRVLQMNPAEGTLLIEMVKPSSGPFGFYIARKKDSGESGSVFISRLSDSYPDKMFSGLMHTGDEITEVNGTDVSSLSLDQVYDLILDSERTLLKLRPSQVHVV